LLLQVFSQRPFATEYEHASLVLHVVALLPYEYVHRCTQAPFWNMQVGLLLHVVLSAIILHAVTQSARAVSQKQPVSAVQEG